MRSAGPWVESNLGGFELTFEFDENGPLFIGEVNGGDGNHLSGIGRFVTWLDGFAADVSDSEGEDAFGGHELKLIASGVAHEDPAVLVEGAAGWHFEGCPEAKLRAGGLLVGGTDDDMSGERILLEHEIERGVQFVFGNAPCDEGTVCEVGCDEGLADAPDSAGVEHGADAFDDGFEGYSGFFGDFEKWFANEALDFVLGDGEDLRVQRVVVFDGCG